MLHRWFTCSLNLFFEQQIRFLTPPPTYQHCGRSQRTMWSEMCAVFHSSNWLVVPRIIPVRPFKCQGRAQLIEIYAKITNDALSIPQLPMTTLTCHARIIFDPASVVGHHCRNNHWRLGAHLPGNDMSSRSLIIAAGSSSFCGCVHSGLREHVIVTNSSEFWRRYRFASWHTRWFAWPTTLNFI